MFAYFGFESLPQSESPGGVRRPPGHPQNSQPDHALSTGLGGAEVIRRPEAGPVERIAILVVDPMRI